MKAIANCYQTPGTKRSFTLFKVSSFCKRPWQNVGPPSKSRSSKVSAMG